MFKIYGDPESPLRGVFKRYGEPESPNEGCVRYLKFGIANEGHG